MSDSLPQEIVKSADGENITVDEVTDRNVQLGVAYWRALCGGRRFPARTDLTLRAMTPFISHVVILRVIDGGADYEYGFAGDAHIRAFKVPFKGIRVSQIEAAAPDFGKLLRAAYDRARSAATPFAVRGRVDMGFGKATPHYHETAFLPLGDSDDAVDHLLIVGVQIPRPFWDITAQSIETIAGQLRGNPPA
ncbi:MAG TPA: hypothetical protein VGH02_00535 [Rhizomicrobium sp.]|jgi:hypothetical protein